MSSYITNLQDKSINFEERMKQIFIEHNKIRTDPKSYISKLQTWLPKFRENTLYLLNENPLRTFEGKQAVEDAIHFLSTQSAVPELTYSEELSKAAMDHVNDIGENGLTTHEGSNGNSVSDRIEQYTEWDGSCAENIDFGFTEAENIIMNILVDDGIKERYQRANLFSTVFKFVGIGMGKHRDLNVSTVFVYAKGLREIGKPPKDGVDYIQNYIQKTLYKKNPVNAFQEEDPDAPDDTVSMKVIKTNKVVNGQKKKITKKIYLLKDKTQHIIEIEEN